MYDVIVIGAGPAGANAALTAKRNGLKVLLVDEQPAAGGQVWRAKSKSILKAPLSDASLKGDALRAALKDSAIEVKYNTRLWQIENHGYFNWFLALQEEDNHITLTAKAVIFATGAQERIIPVPGWTLPGVMGLGAATAIFKEYMMVPGKNTLVAGNGPLLFFVASEIIRFGGNVAAMVSLNNRRDWAMQFPAMMTNPKMLMLGLKWFKQLRTHKVPVFWQHGIKNISGQDQVEAVTISKVDNNWQLDVNDVKTFDIDSICYGHGLMPAIEATRLAGADHHFDPALGGWLPTVDKNGRTSVKSLYACGDNAGILGALAAPHRGSLAALAALNDLTGSLINEQLKKQKNERHLLNKTIKFAMAATALTIPRPGMVSFMDENTEICRCEGIIRADIEAEIKDGGISSNVIKSATRSGMGPCGGRYCLDIVAMLNEKITGRSRCDIDLPTARPPLRPIAIDQMADDLNYDDLAIPEVSPL